MGRGDSYETEQVVRAQTEVVEASLDKSTVLDFILRSKRRRWTFQSRGITYNNWICIFRRNTSALLSRINWRVEKKLGNVRKWYREQNRNLELTNLNIQPRLAAAYAEWTVCMSAFVCVHMFMDYVEHTEGLPYSVNSPTTFRQPRNRITPLGFKNISRPFWLKDRNSFRVKAGILDIYIFSSLSSQNPLIRKQKE